MKCHKNWDSYTPDGRLDALRDDINEHLQSEGYDPVNVEVGDLGGYDEDGNGTWAETSQNEDGSVTVTFDEDHLNNEDVEDLVDTSYHEAEHAKQYFDGEDYGELSEMSAWDAGSAASADYRDKCKDPESSSDDGDDDDEPPLPLPPLEQIPDSPPDGIEFDLEHMGDDWTL